MENRWEHISFEGSLLPHPDYAVDKSGEVDESGTAEGPGAINESEIVESEEAHFGESEEISEKYSGQEGHSDSSEHVYSCSDSNNSTNSHYLYITDGLLFNLLLGLQKDIVL